MPNCLTKPEPAKLAFLYLTTPGSHACWLHATHEDVHRSIVAAVTEATPLPVAVGLSIADLVDAVLPRGWCLQSNQSAEPLNFLAARSTVLAALAAREPDFESEMSVGIAYSAPDGEIEIDEVSVCGINILPLLPYGEVLQQTMKPLFEEVRRQIENSEDYCPRGHIRAYGPARRLR